MRKRVNVDSPSFYYGSTANAVVKTMLIFERVQIIVSFLSHF